MTPFARKQAAARSTAAMFPCLLEISHEDYGTFRYANAPEDIEFGGVTWVSASFSVQPPERDGSRVGDATLTISSVDQFWIQKIRGTLKPAKARFIAVILYDERGLHGCEPLEDNSFTLRSASWTETSISWRMVFDENMALVVPADTVNALTAPGIL